MTWLQTHACIECGEWPCKCNTELNSIADKAVERIIKDYTAVDKPNESTMEKKPMSQTRATEALMKAVVRNNESIVQREDDKIWARFDALRIEQTGKSCYLISVIHEGITLLTMEANGCDLEMGDVLDIEKLDARIEFHLSSD